MHMPDGAIVRALFAHQSDELMDRDDARDARDDARDDDRNACDDDRDARDDARDARDDASDIFTLGGSPSTWHLYCKNSNRASRASCALHTFVIFSWKRGASCKNASVMCALM